ncbi:MAG TPA: dihydrofolate reductase family protein [Polyangiales bacterium]
MPSSPITSGRPRCSVFIATSVDGYIARRDGSIDWLSSVEREGEDYGYKKFMESVDTVVLGRNTYDFISREPAWPFQGKRVVVLTHRPAAAKHGEQFFSGKPEQLVEQLGKRGAQSIYVDGGTAVRGFLAAGLIDRMTISVVPVVLGGGIPLFGEGVGENPLVLEESRAFSTGLMQLRYRLGARGKDRRPSAPLSATR